MEHFPRSLSKAKPFQSHALKNSLQLLTREQLAQSLGLSPSFISKLMSTEGLPHFKIGKAVRFRPEDVTAWLQKRSRP